MAEDIAYFFGACAGRAASAAGRSAPLLRRRAAVGLLGLTLLSGRSTAQAPATVVAASDLQFALPEVAALFERHTGHRLRLVFGSSGNFHAQIQQGAPFHLFLSADESFVFSLADAGRTLDRGRRYARGRIGILVPEGSPLKADGRLHDLAAALRDGRLKKFAIANPEHAPYGRGAQEALRHAGLWDAIRPRLVFGENVSQALQFAASGAAQGGLIAQSLALAPAAARLGRFELVPEAWHQPLLQRMVLLRDAPAAARAFHDFVASAQAQAVLVRHGFAMPPA